MRPWIALTMLCLAVWMPTTGCASQTRTVRVEERVQQPAGDAQAPQESVVARRTASVSTQQEPRGGLLSGMIHFVGEILALPFRLIGGLIRSIF